MIVNETEGGRHCHKESLISALANIERQQRNRNTRTLAHPIGEDGGRRPLDLDSLDHEIHHIPIKQKHKFGNNLAHSATKTSNSYQPNSTDIRPPIVSPSTSMTKKLNTNQWVAGSKDPTIEEVSNIKIQDMDIEVISPPAKKRQAAKFGGRKSSFMVDKKKAETQKLVKEMNLL